MSKLWIVLAAILASGAACDVDRGPTETVEVGKPVESSPPARDEDHEFTNIRASYQTAVRERLNKIDAEIAGLATSSDHATQETARKLRVQSAALAKKVDTASYQAKSGWDEFQSGVTREIDQLEDELDQANH